MARFRKKPVEVEAVQWNGPGDHLSVVTATTGPWVGQNFCNGRQGSVAVDVGDWIIAEMDGSGFYPCKPDVFAATYDPIDEAPT